MIKHASNDNFDSYINEDFVIVDFFATWCGPCKMLGSVLEKYSEKNDVNIVKVDVDELGEKSNEYKIYSVPTLIIFKNGKEYKRVSGYMSYDELDRWIKDE